MTEQGGRCSSVCCCLPGLPRRLRLRQVAATDGSASPTTSDIDTAPEYRRAAVTLDGRVLFYVRGIASYPAARRAREISESIRKIAADPSISPDSLRAVEGAEHTNIVTGDRTVLTVFNVDAELEGASRPPVHRQKRRNRRAEFPDPE